MPATHEEPLYPGYEALLPWHQRQPFDGVEQFPCVIGREQASYLSWSLEPGNAIATWVYVGHAQVESGDRLRGAGPPVRRGESPKPGAVLRGFLMLSNPDTSGVIELQRGDAASIPAHAWSVGDETCEILWWVPGELQTDQFKHAISTKEHGEWRWYPRSAVMLNGDHLANAGFPSHLEDLRAWPLPTARKAPMDMQHLPRATWLHLLPGTDPRLTALVSFFYCDETIRCGKVALPRGRESQPGSRSDEKTLYLESGALSVNLTGRGTSLLAGPADVVFLPPGTEHSLQALGDEPVSILFAEVV